MEDTTHTMGSHRVGHNWSNLVATAAAAATAYRLGENIFANHATDKGLISKVYK